MKATEFGAPGEAIGLQQTLQNAPKCKRIAMIQLATYILSFALTWYLVWWDSLIGFGVAIWGYYMLLNEYTRPTVKHVEIVSTYTPGFSCVFTENCFSFTMEV